MNRYRWHLLPPAPARYLNNTAGLPPLVAQLLFNRGLIDSTQIESFLTADARLVGDPLLLPDMHQAIARIYQALLRGENIAVYGDFDTDGVTATTLLVHGLTSLGAKVTPYIPHRMTEGYGLNHAALEKLHRQGISLVISVDCGITAVNEVKRAKRLGLDIIITDHHTPLETIPPATAIIDPKRTDSAYPFTELSGVGVALKLLQALFQGMGKETQLEGLLDLAALGTVADMAPLLGENRYLVRQGLKLINGAPRLGIREMLTQAGLDTGTLDAETISWVLAPRLNAAGRLAHAMTSYKLLMTESPLEARNLAMWLEEKNTERQQLTSRVFTQAREQVLGQPLSPLLIASDREFPPGICGLVASRLVEEFYRPTLVIRTGDQISSGSARSIPEFNIILALDKFRHLLTRYGGHSQAAGFSLLTRNLAHLENALLQLATIELAGVELQPRLDIDAEVKLSQLGGNTFSLLQKLAPFGTGNPLPTFLSRGVKTVDCRTMGNGGAHLRLKLKQDGVVWNAVSFGLGECLPEITPTLDVVYNLEIDRWNGQESLRLNVVDFRGRE